MPSSTTDEAVAEPLSFDVVEGGLGRGPTGAATAANRQRVLTGHLAVEPLRTHSDGASAQRLVQQRRLVTCVHAGSGRRDLASPFLTFMKEVVDDDIASSFRA
jgi:hypothetical protein